MPNQFLKLRRSAVPGRIPTTSSLDFGEIALNTYDGLAFMKKSGSSGEQIVTLGTGTGNGSITGSRFFLPIFNSTSSLVTSSIFQSSSFTAIGVTSSLHPNALETFLVNSLTDSYNLISGHATIDNYVQLNIKNFSGGVSASSDIVATADTGNEGINYINMGINGSGYTAGNAIGGALDAYLYNTGENLYIGNTAPSKQIVFFNGGFDVNANAALFIHDQGTITINTANYNYTNPPSLAVQAPNSTTNTLIEGVGNTDQFLQLVVSNQNSGSFASADIVAYNNLDPTNQGSGFIDMGISSTNYSDPTNYPGWQTGHSYLYTDAPGLKIGSTSGSSLINLFVGGINPAENSKLILRANNQHSMTGSLQVTGGLEVIGSLTNGYDSTAVAIYSHAEGFGATATGDYSHAEGELTTANGQYSHAEGSSTIANGYSSHAEGTLTTATGDYSHAEGRQTTANGYSSHTEGILTTATGDYSHAEGSQTRANGYSSHAEGLFTIASGSYQHVQGQYNISSSGQSAFIIGNGTSTTARRNLVFASGSVFQITGSLQISGSITGSLFGTASWATNSISSSYPFRVTGSSNSSIYSVNAGEGTNNDFSYFIGYKAGLSASNSTYSTFIGDFAGAVDNGNPVDSRAAVMIGSDAGYNANNSFLGVYIGNRAGMNATNASESVFVGNQAGESGSQAASSVMIGTAAGYFSSQSRGAVFIGRAAGFSAPNASNMVAIGFQSGLSATNASSSVFIGYRAGYNNPNTSYSNFIGYQAGLRGNILGTNNTIIGTNITLPAGYSNYANIGAVIFVSGTYSTVTGNPSQAVSNGRVGINVINPTLGMLQVSGNVYASSFTGSLFGTASWADNATTSSYILTAVSASYAATASIATNALFASTASYADNFTVAGTLTAQTIVVQTITSSTDFVTGSTRFGSLLSNTHQFTGSVSITGSLAVNESNVILSNQTSSMSVATASYVLNAVSASFASTALNATTASYVLQAVSASFATTASYWSGSILNATSASFASTASYVLNAISASYASNGGVTQIIAGTNVTISPVGGSGSVTINATGGGGAAFPYTGSAIITGSLTVTGSTSVQLLNVGNSQFNNTSSATAAGTTIVSSIATGSYTSAFYRYTIASASNARAGEVMSVWNGSTVRYTEVTTTDIGNTSTAVFSVAISTGNVVLNLSSSGGWTVKSIANLL